MRGVSFLAGCVTLLQFFEAGNYLLVTLDVIVLVTSLLVMLEAGGVIAAHRRAGSDVKNAS